MLIANLLEPLPMTLAAEVCRTSQSPPPGHPVEFAHLKCLSGSLGILFRALEMLFFMFLDVNGLRMSAT